MKESQYNNSHNYIFIGYVCLDFNTGLLQLSKSKTIKNIKI